MTATTDLLVTFVHVRCGACDVIFGMEERYYKARKDDHRTWYCPNGHARVYNASSEAERLRSELEAEQRRLKWAREETEQANRRAVSAEMSRRVTKGHLTRIKKRVGAGVCPACKRTVRQLADHMKCKHPDFAKVAE